jgi:hypothetical protein
VRVPPTLVLTDVDVEQANILDAIKNGGTPPRLFLVALDDGTLKGKDLKQHSDKMAKVVDRAWIDKWENEDQVNIVDWCIDLMRTLSTLAAQEGHEERAAGKKVFATDQCFDLSMHFRFLKGDKCVGKSGLKDCTEGGTVRLKDRLGESIGQGDPGIYAADRDASRRADHQLGDFSDFWQEGKYGKVWADGTPFTGDHAKPHPNAQNDCVQDCPDALPAWYPRVTADGLAPADYHLQWRPALRNRYKLGLSDERRIPINGHKNPEAPFASPWQQSGSET